VISLFSSLKGSKIVQRKLEGQQRVINQMIDTGYHMLGELSGFRLRFPSGLLPWATLSLSAHQDARGGS